MPSRRSSSTNILSELTNSPKSNRRQVIKKDQAPVDPELTSDYGGSETSSRAVTPSTTPSPTPPASTTSSPQTTKQPVELQSVEMSGIGDNEASSKSTVENDVKEEVKVEEMAAPLLRAADIKSDLDDTLDTKEIDLGIGVLSAEAIKEEELAEQKNAEEAKIARKKESEQEKMISKQERRAMLQDLLKKSEFFTDYLKKKMQDDLEADRIRREKREQKIKKAQEEGRVLEEKAAKTPKGRKRKIVEQQSVDSPSGSKKMKTDIPAERFFNGQKISDRQPILLSGGVMRSYQLDGYEWLAKLYENGINGILADEMGLGKTIQTIALFCFLYEQRVPGPYLVVAPLSTIPNWVNEFNRFAPTIPCILYHGNANARAELRKEIGVSHYNEEFGIKMNKVVVTSYEIAMNDRQFLGPVGWKFLVVDEGHRLKNMNCRLIKSLKLYITDNRLLLTGTPLQNNLRELFSLLNFILPEIFDDVQVFESWFDAKEIEEEENSVGDKLVDDEKQGSVVNTLHQILLPFLRRRVKVDVGLEIPPKKEVLVYCPLTELQKKLYQAVVEKTIADIVGEKKEEEIDLENLGKGKRAKEAIDYSIFDKDDAANDDKFEDFLAKYAAKKDYTYTSYNAYNYKDNLSTSETNFSVKNRIMDMRKSVNHPYLIEYPITDAGFYKIDEEVIGVCGKMKVMDQMINALVKEGHKVLIFSQMTRMMDILGDYLNWRNIKFSRLDGSMHFTDRQKNIDDFNTNPNVNVFILSTRAGGLGINLTAADTCIIYDSDWNPQQDLQAQDRCHRIGQTSPVMVYRLVTKGTVDEKIVLRAAAKRKIEKLVIHKDKFNSVTADTKEKASMKINPEELLELLHSQDHVGAVTCDEGQVLSDNDIKQLLDRSDMAWGDNSKTKKVTAKKEVAGLFKVLEDDGAKAGGLDSVVEA